MAEATKCPAKIESSACFLIAAVSSFDVRKPISSDINESRHHTTSYASKNEDNPYLAGIMNLPEVSHQPYGVVIQHSQSLPLFRILVDPIDGCEIVVSNTTTRPFNVPVQRTAIFDRVLWLEAGWIARPIKVWKDGLGRIAGSLIQT